MSVTKKESVNAVVSFAGRHDYEQEHTFQVTNLALMLFDELKDLHKLTNEERFLLHCGALLHDIGWSEGRKAHHKTALEKTVNSSDLPFNNQNKKIIGLIARYHRKALPKDKHQYYGELSESDKHRVKVLAGILRVADGLDRSHCSVVEDIRARLSENSILLECKCAQDPWMEIQTAMKKSDLMSMVFQRDIRIISK